MKKGFIFIETIIVVTILTVALMSIYANYSKIISNTKEFNTFDTAEYNYKTYFLKQMYVDNKFGTISQNTCKKDIVTPFSDNKVKICILNNAFNKWSYLNTADGYAAYTNIDAYIIDYLNNQDWTENNDNIYLVEYKKKDKQTNEYFTYISSLNY